MIKHLYPDITNPKIGIYRAIPEIEDYAVDAFLGMRIAMNNNLPYRVKITRDWGDRKFGEMLTENDITFKKVNGEYIVR